MINTSKADIRSTGIFVAIANNTLYGTIFYFSMMPKMIRHVSSRELSLIHIYFNNHNTNRIIVHLRYTSLA